METYFSTIRSENMFWQLPLDVLNLVLTLCSDADLLIIRNFNKYLYRMVDRYFTQFTKSLSRDPVSHGIIYNNRAYLKWLIVHKYKFSINSIQSILMADKLELYKFVIKYGDRVYLQSNVCKFARSGGKIHTYFHKGPFGLTNARARCADVHVEYKDIVVTIIYALIIFVTFIVCVCFFMKK